VPSERSAVLLRQLCAAIGEQQSDLRGDGQLAGAPLEAALAGGFGRSLVSNGWAATMLAVVMSISAGASLVSLDRTTAAESPPETKSDADPGLAPGQVVDEPARTDQYGDPLPPRALLRLGTVRYRAIAPNDGALSRDGKTLATASWEEITLWDVATGRPLRHLRDAMVPADVSPNQTFLAFSPDGTRLVSLSGWDPPPGFYKGDKQHIAVQVWEVASGKRVQMFDMMGGTAVEHTLPARSVWFTPNGKELGIALHSGLVRFVDPTSGLELRRYYVGKGLREECPGVAPSPDGKLLAVVDSREETTLRLLDSANAAEVWHISAKEKLETVAFSPDCTILAATSTNCIYIFDAETGKERQSLPVTITRDSESFGLTALVFSPDGKTLYAGDQQGQILRWRMSDGVALSNIGDRAIGSGPNQATWITGLFPAPDGRSLISFSWQNGQIRRWDTTTGKELPAPDGFRGAVHSDFSPDGRTIAVGDAGGKLELFETATGRRLRVLRTAGSAVSVLRWSPDGRSLAVGHRDAEVSLWDADGGRPGRKMPSPPEGGNGRPGWVDDLAYSPDGRSLLIATFSSGMRLLDAGTGTEIWKRADWGKVAFAPDGASFASAGPERASLIYTSLQIGDSKTGALRFSHKLSSTNESVTAVVFAPDGRWLATSSRGGPIRLRDPKTGEELRHIDRPMGLPKRVRCSSIAFSSDGKWLLSGWTDNSIRLCEVSSGVELFHRTGHRAQVADVHIGPDFRTALSCSSDGTALLWDLCPWQTPPRQPSTAMWDDLISSDASKAYAAIWQLIGDPQSAVAMLRTKLPVASAPGPGDLRRMRAVQAMEIAMTPEARALLRDWAGGVAHDPLTEEARSAVARLEQRDKRRGPPTPP
jgi:WD40 repeat protein